MSTFSAPNDYRSYLKHHGIKGQKWGVRHGPPYPIKTGIMAKHTRLNSTQWSKQRPVGMKRIYTYNPNNAHDTKIYTGPFAKYTQGRKKDVQMPPEIFGGAMSSLYENYTPPVYTHEYETKKDLKIAGKEDQIDAAYDIVKNTKMAPAELKQIKDYMEECHKKGESLTPRNKTIAEAKIDFNNITPKDKEIVFDTLNAMMEACDNFTTTRAFEQAMKTKFDGIVDFNNQAVYNEAQDPVVIFDPDKNLRILDIKEIPMSMIDQNLEDIRAYMRERGKNAAL